MIFLDRDNEFTKVLIDDVNNNERQNVSTEDRMKLIAKATLDRRLNARDLKVYNYILCFEHLGCTQEKISELLDMSRSNINKSIEKLASFNYIEKVEIEDEMKKKRMSYKLKPLSKAGLINCIPDEIIRVLNVSNVFNKDYKYTYCSHEDIRDIKLKIDTYKEHIDCIEKYYDCSNEYAKGKAYAIVEAFDMVKKSKEVAINNLKDEIKRLNDIIADTKSMKRKLTVFSRNIQSNILDREAIDEVLANMNAKFILFIDRTDDKRFDNFKEKYLENYIKFVCMFENLAENENFFKLYYENKKIEITFSELIRMLGYTHREVPERRSGAAAYIEEKIDEFKNDIIKNLDMKSKKEDLTEKDKILLDEIVELSDKIATNGVYSSREVALLLYTLDKKIGIKHSLGLSYTSFVELYNPDLLELLKDYEEIKKENNKEVVVEHDDSVTPKNLESVV